jgi:RNA polymerase sigma-70 factor (ECF subfamily)
LDVKLFPPLSVVIDREDVHVDEWLIRKARDGDPASFNELVERHTPTLYRVVRRLTSDGGEAESIVQEAWLRAWKSLSRCDAQRLFLPWLVRIAINVARDAWRKKRPLDFSDLGENPEWKMDQEPSVEEQLEKGEAVDTLLRGVDALRTEYRLAIALRYDGGLSYEEIAQIMNVPLNTVRTYLHRAKSFLRKWMEDECVGFVG